MKICLLLSVSLFWNIAAVALCQEMLGATVLHHASSAGPGHLQAFADGSAAECSCEGDCQIPWGTYSHGYLWENYCFEKRARLTRETCCPHGGREALFEVARQRRVSCAGSPDRRRAALSGRLQRERIICFDLFFELLGWSQCACCVHSCQHRGSCCQHQPAQSTEPQPVAPSVPAEESAPTLALPPQSAHDAPAAEQSDDSQRAPEVTKPSKAEPETPAAAPVADPVDASSTPPLDDPPPAVPHNTIPQSVPATKEPAQGEASPAGPTLSRPTRGRNVIRVAERLSDYIKTY